MTFKRSYLTAFAIALVASGWVASGLIAPPEAANVDPTADPVAETTLPRVRVVRLAAAPYAREIVVQGQTQASRKVEIRAQTRGTVAEVPVEPGRKIEAGTVLVRLETGDRRVALDQAMAQLEHAQIEFRAAQNLGQKGLSSELRHAEARSRLEAARAAVTRAELELAHGEITAPFAGILNSRTVEIGSYVNAGDSVGALIALDPLRVTGDVSERDIQHAVIGGPALVRLLDGRALDGAVRYVSAAANPATRTFAIEVEIPNPEGRIVEGLTAEIRIAAGQVSAHLISPALLSIDDDGRIGVKAVDADRKVRFHPVEILAQTPDGAWIDGLPETVDLITVGQAFVRDGVEVEAVPATDDQS